MRTYEVININHVLPEVVPAMLLHGVARPSRLGPVLEFPSPVATVYSRPWEKVLFCPVRNANPFFHFFEALWMLAGRCDVDFLAYFNKRMAEYSDNGSHFRGAYGYRWRYHFGMDQLVMIVNELKSNPDSRRAVLQIWDVRKDLRQASSDIPCNTMVFFKVRNDKLHMTVCNRSNDLIWGAYGANVVHFSMLQEYLAARLAVGIGPYTQISDSLHVYTENPQWDELVAKYGNVLNYMPEKDLYRSMDQRALFTPGDADLFMFELQDFIAGMTGVIKGFHEKVRVPDSPMLSAVALPLFWAWHSWKKGDWESAQRHAAACQSEDWSYAAFRWLQRAIEKKGGQACMN